MAEATSGYAGSYAPAISSQTADYNFLSRPKTRDSTAEQLKELDSLNTDSTSDIKNDWKYISEVEDMQSKNSAGGIKARKLGVTWKNLSVQGAGADIVYVSRI